jgi:DNA-binding CsgD family transcriptional regulator
VREREVAELLVEGLTNPEIAGVMHISPRTVQSHIEQARIKLGARNRTHLAAQLLRCGLLPLDPEPRDFSHLAD